jgi:hypothetical protein
MHNTSAMTMLPWASFVIATIWLPVNLDFFIKPPVVNSAMTNRKFHFQNDYLYGGVMHPHIKIFTKTQ